MTKLKNVPIGARTLPNALRMKSYCTNINSFKLKNYCNIQGYKTSTITFVVVGVLLVTKLINMPIYTRTLPNALRIKSYGTIIDLLSMKNYCNTQRSKVKHSHHYCCQVFDDDKTEKCANWCQDSAKCSQDQNLQHHYRLIIYEKLL